MNYLQLREDLEKACHQAASVGIQTGSGGNVSARIPEQELMLVKASGSGFADASVDGFVITDFEGKLVEGAGKPTREALLHGLIYKNYPKVQAVVHTHSPYSIALAHFCKEIERVTWHSQLKIVNSIPVIDIPSAMVRSEDIPVVEELFSHNAELKAFVLKGHGLVAFGKSIIDAEQTAELVEETAMIAFLERLGK